MLMQKGAAAAVAAKRIGVMRIHLALGLLVFLVCSVGKKLTEAWQCMNFNCYKLAASL